MGGCVGLGLEVIDRESWWAQTVGVGPRRTISEGVCYRFFYEGVAERGLHMLWVGCPLGAIWLVDGTVTATAELRPVVGSAAARADTVLELHPTHLDHVSVGDEVVV